MQNWSQAKKDCYYDFIEQMLKDGYIRKKRKEKSVQQDWMPEEFERIYNTYPRKAGKPAAQKAWNALRADLELIAKIDAHLESAYLETDKCFIPHFSTYLNQQRYNDEIVIIKKKLLSLPADDNLLESFAREHGLQKPGRTATYFEYRNQLKQEIIDKNITI